MKISIVTLLLTSLFSSVYAQDIAFDVSTRYDESVLANVLSEAETVDDLKEGYPTAWINDYVYVEVETSYHGEVRKAIGTNATLTTEQRNILNSAAIGTDLTIEVRHNHKNAITGVTSVDTLNFGMTVGPEIGAEYKGGDENMKQYLKASAIDHISDEDAKQIQFAIVRFTVNENGETTDVEMAKTSENEQIDQLLIDAIQNMPNWQPAKDIHGNTVKQGFELRVGDQMGC